jgi:hypothetical protein
LTQAYKNLFHYTTSALYSRVTMLRWGFEA